MTKNFKEILQYPDKRLLEKSTDIKNVDNDVRNLFRDLEVLAKANSKAGITLVGLSGPQLGWNVRAFIYYDFNKKKYIPVVNPKLVYSSKELTTEWEGCASVGSGQKSLFGPVARSKSCQIEFTDLEGESQIVSVSNYMSHIILHEVDHLDGIIFLDRVNDPNLILTASELDDYAKKHNGKYPKV
jgi:peptide deformylase